MINQSKDGTINNFDRKQKKKLNTTTFKMTVMDKYILFVKQLYS